MSAATFSTSSKRSCSYKLLVNPSPVRAMPDNASLHRNRSWAETMCGTLASASATSRRLTAGQRRQHGPLHLLAPADVDLRTACIGDVEGVDDLGAEGGDLGVADVEVQRRQRARDAVQDGDAVRSPDLDQRGARRSLAVDEDTGRRPTRDRGAPGRVRADALGEPGLDWEPTFDCGGQVVLQR